jgi:hypothetical protein
LVQGEEIIMKRLFAAALACTALAMAWGAPALAASSVVGAWDITSETAQGKRQATMTVTEAAGAYAVSFVPKAPADGSAPPTITVSNVAVQGDTLTFKMVAGLPQGPVEVAYSVTAAGDALTGTGTSANGNGKITGVRKK